MKEEAKFQIDGQWFYRGNVANTWFARNTLPDGSMGGLADRVPSVCWPFLEYIVDLLAVLDGKRRLTRELDVAMHGEEGAAKQASLCDLIPMAKALREKASARPEERHKAALELLVEAREALNGTYDVQSYPANGKTEADRVIRNIDSFLSLPSPRGTK